MSDYELKPAWSYVSMSERMHECEQQTLRWRLVCGRSSVHACGCVRVFSTLCKQTDRSKAGRKNAQAENIALVPTCLIIFSPSTSSLQAELSVRHPDSSNVHQQIEKRKTKPDVIKVSNNFTESHFTQCYRRGELPEKKTLNWKPDTNGRYMCERNSCSGT